MTDLPPPPRSERTDRLYHLSLLAYVVVVIAAAALAGIVEAGWLRVAIAAVAAAAFLYPVVVWTRMDRQRGGVERWLTLESTSLAYFATLTATGGYALFEQLADAPRISMYWAFLFAVFAWGAVWIALGRRVS